MPLADEIQARSHEIFHTTWAARNGTVVPDPSSVKLGNDAVYFERATVLYADLDASTNMVEGHSWYYSAEVYKAFLYAASRLIRQLGGTIVSYDGDRVMGIFIGDAQTSLAAQCALKINYAVKKIVQKELASMYTASAGTIKHIVGIDTTEIRAVRTGVRGDNDLVWVGNAANFAAKLTAEDSSYATWITSRAYNRLNADSKFANGVDMWTPRLWSAHNSELVYASDYWWEV